MKISPPVARWIFALPWVICFGILVWLIAWRFPLDGKIHFVFAFDGTSPWFDAFLPAERVTPVGSQEGGWVGQRVKAEPVYAGARLPGMFDQVTVGLNFKPTHQPLLEFGMLRDPQTSSFELRPLWSEALSHGWRRVAAGSLRGYVKPDQPDSVLGSSDFEHLLVWRAATSSPKLMDHARETRTISLDLSGSHDFFLVPTDGELHFNFQLEDATPQIRSVDVRLERDNQIFWTHPIPADQEFKMAVQGVPAGVYKLSVRTPDDKAHITRITTNMRHWVVGPRINLAAGVRVWTNSHHLTPIVASAPIHPGDTRVISDGYFAFDEAALFLPQPRRLVDATDTEQEKIIGVLTPYEPPEVLSDGWLRAHSSFSLDRVQDRVKFVLSAPGLVSRQGFVDVRAVDLLYMRPSFSWQEFLRTMRRELSGARKRFSSKL